MSGILVVQRCRQDAYCLVVFFVMFPRRTALLVVTGNAMRIRPSQRRPLQKGVVTPQMGYLPPPTFYHHRPHSWVVQRLQFDMLRLQTLPLLAQACEVVMVRFVLEQYTCRGAH